MTTTTSSTATAYFDRVNCKMFIAFGFVAILLLKRQAFLTHNNQHWIVWQISLSFASKNWIEMVQNSLNAIT